MQLKERVVDDVLARLRRIEGQVGGLIRMVESGREWRRRPSGLGRLPRP